MRQTTMDRNISIMYLLVQIVTFTRTNALQKYKRACIHTVMLYTYKSDMSCQSL